MSVGLFSRIFPIERLITSGPKWTVESNLVKVRVTRRRQNKIQHLTLEEFRHLDRSVDLNEPSFAANSKNMDVLNLFYGRRYLLQLAGGLYFLSWLISLLVILFIGFEAVRIAADDSGSGLKGLREITLTEGGTLTTFGVIMPLSFLITFVFSITRVHILNGAEAELMKIKMDRSASQTN